MCSIFNAALVAKLVFISLCHTIHFWISCFFNSVESIFTQCTLAVSEMAAISLLKLTYLKPFIQLIDFDN